jgi:hypothetical protein
MTAGALGIVKAWQLAVNGASVGDAVALTAEHVAVTGPRGEGLIPGDELGAWMVRSGFTATPLRWFCGGNGTVVVEQDARWVDRETGQERGRAVVASCFKVDDGVVSRVVRHDEGLQAALDSAGLSSADEVLDRA